MESEATAGFFETRKAGLACGICFNVRHLVSVACLFGWLCNCVLFTKTISAYLFDEFFFIKFNTGA